MLLSFPGEMKVNEPICSQRTSQTRICSKGISKAGKLLVQQQPLLTVPPLLAQAGYSSWLLMMTWKKGTWGGLSHGSAFEELAPTSLGLWSSPGAAGTAAGRNRP